MHAHSNLSKPSPKRSLSCAGLDDLEALLHGMDSGNRKRRQSFSQNALNETAPSASPASQSQHDSTASSSLRHIELPVVNEKPTSSDNHELVESQYPDHAQINEHNRHPNDSNCPENQLQDLDDAFHSDAENENDVKFNDQPLTYPSSDPENVALKSKENFDQGELAEKRLEFSRFQPLSHHSVGTECSPREEFLVQAFGPSGFKLYSNSVSSDDDVDDSLSDDSSGNNRELRPTIVDADTELKRSFNELEADIRDATHQPAYPQLGGRFLTPIGQCHQTFVSPSYGLNRHAIFPQNNQSAHHMAMFGQSLDGRPYDSFSQKETSLFSHNSPSSSLVKTLHNKENSIALHTSTKWLRDEDERLRLAVARFGGKNWKMIAESLGNGRTDVQCLHRWNKVLKPGLIKGPWTPEEDRILTSLITRYGVGKIRWCDLALHLPGRIGKQCRERWCNHLDSRIRKGQWASEEDDMVFRWQQKLGNKWSEIAKLLPGRTENAVKNRFNSAARRKWLMNQENKTLSTSLVPSTSQTYPQLQQETVMPSISDHLEERSFFFGSTMPYRGEKVSPLPSSEALMNHHVNTMAPALSRENFLQHYALPDTSLLDARRSSQLDRQGSDDQPPGSMTIDQSFKPQEHDNTTETLNSDSMSSPRSLEVVPPLVRSGSSHHLHHLASTLTNCEVDNSRGFPNPAPLHASTSADVLSIKSEEKQMGSPVLQIKEEKQSRDLIYLATSTSATPDPSVPMDDENMNSFLDSVALELDDMME
ncbi:hypothetical protein CCR75_004895 [Bremia lactucae]|uniref:Uncharacterized protein n=1 Tax=Bremia lactucae TaxID=4779 RepID=A0A976IBK5_BRELC|nr:hypothetical protein CCR75_004895 [Bremia lactucae]